MKGYSEIAKAVNGAAVSFLAALGASVTTGHITGVQWVVATVSGVIGFSAVYAANGPTPPGAV